MCAGDGVEVADGGSRQRPVTDTSVGAWRVMCQTNDYPGQWQAWFREQVCAVGWPSEAGYLLDIKQPARSQAWSTARNALKEMQIGHRIVAMLPGGRVGRMGEIVRLEVEDHQWDPIVRPGPELPHGENGRRIIVRWDLTIGPIDPGMIVRLPRGLRDNGQAAISRITFGKLKLFKTACADKANWEPVHGAFKFERALSDYIAMHPHRLEDGLSPNASVPTIREWVVSPSNRIDVVLEDASGTPVLVECKQDGATEACVEQLVRYLNEVVALYPQWGRPRGILVHGGARNVAPAVRHLAEGKGITLVHHELRVDFSAS